MNEQNRPVALNSKPLAVIVALVLAGQLVIWTIPNWGHQSMKWLFSLYLAGGGLVAVLLWFLFFSRLSLKIRFIGLATLAGLGVFLVSSLEVREVDGNVMPILAWTWSAKPDEDLSNKTVTAEGVISLRPSSNDYPRFLGARSSATIEDIDLARDWQANPPKETWRIPVGAAWSGFAVRGGLAVTQEQRGEAEMVTCYNLASGELIWAHGDDQRFATTVGGNGPRATPTIAGNRVYTMGALGLLNCLELATGRLIWQRKVAEENGAEQPRWGYSCSPLVLDNGNVVVSPGGPKGRSLVAYHVETGDQVWAAGDAKPGYSSPQMASLAGTPMILIFNNGSVAGHHPNTGQVLWEVAWPADKASVANPRCMGDRVLVSAGYGIGSKMYHITKSQDGFAVQMVYESRRLKAKFANFVLQAEFAYGLDDGVLTCINATTGERMWKRGRYGHGQLLLAGEVLLVQAESGELHMLEAQANAHQELASIPVLGGKSWNSMALAGNKLLMRNHKEAVCLELAQN